MSPEECSLAFDEGIREFEPELSLLVNPRYEKVENSSSKTFEEVTKIVGRMTISF